VKEIPIRTTVVGSYPIPDWLVSAPSQQALIDATKVVFKTQEMAGIDVVADGELYRFDINHPDTNGMIEYFIRPMSGIRSALGRAELAEFRKMAGMGFRSDPAGLADHAIKFTVTGPHMLSKTLMDHHYRDREKLAMAVAKALAGQVSALDPEVIQIDEANISGHPDEGAWAAAAINVVLDAAKLVKEKGVHVCFGNYGGQSIQKGEWRKLIDFMNRLHCDHVVLEFAFRGYEELKYFKGELDERIGLGIGVIDIKVNTVETPEVVAKRIEEAAKNVGAERIKWVHPDCGFWMNKRSVADRKMMNLVKGRDLYLGSR
jgi:5-methyltetrahydropteroyltriglutamate--homocysteine methyltransferase